MWKKILLAVILASILGLIVFVNVKNKPKENYEFTIGNTPGNIMNNGYFCEYKDTIYFSNPNDYDKLYSMDLSCKNFKRIGKTAVSDINCDGNYIYFASRNNKFKDEKESGNTGSVLSKGGIGLIRTSLKGTHDKVLYENAVGDVSLSGNHVYYQRYDKKHGLQLYKVNINETEGKCIFHLPVSPAGIYSGGLYYGGVDKDHNIYKMKLSDESYHTIYQGNTSNVIAFENYIYFLDLNNNYALTRVRMDGSEPEVIVNDRVITYNFSKNGTYLYYQVDNQDESRICVMNLAERSEQILLKGNFSDINVTSNYVFFKEYNTEHVYVINANEAKPKINIFDPPTKK